MLNKLHGHMPETPTLGKPRPEDQKSGASFLDLTPKTLILKKMTLGLELNGTLASLVQSPGFDSHHHINMGYRSDTV